MGTSTALHTLYRFRAADGQLLYVGITCNPGSRFERHRGEKPWWGDIAEITMEQHADRSALTAAEQKAIRDEKPLHNVRMNGDKPTVRKPAVKSPTDTSADSSSGLVGRFFHSWEEHGDDFDEDGSSYVRGNKHVVWQGYVTDIADEDSYLVQTFSWWDGSPYGGEILVTRERMSDWTFYPNADAMQIAMGCGDIDREAGERGRKCRNPATHVIRDSPMGVPVFACWRHIKHYSGTAQEI